jgi:hypothetical protein
MFRTVPLSIIRSYSLYTQQRYMSYRFVDSKYVSILILRFLCLFGIDEFYIHVTVHCENFSVYRPVWNTPLLSVQWITPDDGQRNCLKHVEFHFQNKFEKLVHLVGLILRKITPSYIFYFVLWPTNAQLCHKLSHCYMFRHYRVIIRELVINTLPSYTSISNAAVGNTIYT